MNSLMVIVDNSGEPMSNRVPATWRFCRGGIELFSSVEFSITRDAVPLSVDLFSPSGEFVRRSRIPYALSMFHAGGKFVLNVGTISFT